MAGLVVIDDLNIVGILSVPTKAEAPLVVDANAVLPATVALEGFQAIAGRQTHDVESIGGIELQEFSSGGTLNVGWQVTRSRAAKEFFSLGVGEALEHGSKPDRSRPRRKSISYAKRNF